MQILCGIPNASNAFLKTAGTLESPILISANAFWNDKKQRFQGHEKLWETDIPLSLDCGGFVAMKRYGGYRWSLPQYIEFATTLRPVWWSAMDQCCEPEVAANKQVVMDRVRATVHTLGETYAYVISWKRHLPGWYPNSPMPVLQGWDPEDYETCIRLTEERIFCDKAPLAEIGVNGWPDLVGLGSVCRRNLHGKDGIIAILNRVDKLLPQNTKLHLFGVKSAAAAALKDHPRIASCDSMAWNLAARWESWKTKTPKTQESLAGHMHRWIEKQQEITAPTRQLALL